METVQQRQSRKNVRPYSQVLAIMGNKGTME
jgi:hypothetical protein